MMQESVLGVFFGGVIGDCYGYVFEDKPTVTPDVALKLVADSLSKSATSELIYTDDTQMGLAVLKSCRKKQGYCPADLAETFTTEYFSDGSHRYYGGNIVTVFTKLRDSKYQHPYRPASEQFHGGGSFGNGGGMRASPAALYALLYIMADFERFIVSTTSLTHTHPLAVYGALLQAHATRRVIAIRSKTTAENALSHLNPERFVVALIRDLSHSHYPGMPEVKSRNFQIEQNLVYLISRLNLVKNFLIRVRLGDEPSISEIVKSLGNNLEALNSCPTAIYVFLRSLRPIPYIATNNVLIRCLVLAITLGGDTDSIGCMACALAGGLLGCPADFSVKGDDAVSATPTAFPTGLLARCERLPLLTEFAKWTAHSLLTAKSGLAHDIVNKEAKH